MTWQQWVLVIDIAISGLVILGRGLTESTRRYTVADGVLGAIECGFLIWLVMSL